MIFISKIMHKFSDIHHKILPDAVSQADNVHKFSDVQMFASSNADVFVRKDNYTEDLHGVVFELSGNADDVCEDIFADEENKKQKINFVA